MVISLAELVREVRNIRGKVVLATGVFDLLHEEHRLFLTKAKEAGDVLVVGVESDVRVKRLKGDSRPVWDEGKRVGEVAGLEMVDYAFVLPEAFDRDDDYEALIRELRPDVYAVSGHSPFMDNKVRIMEKFGGVVSVVHAWNPQVSTSRLVDERVWFEAGVVKGHGRGKGLGYPTLNLEIPKGMDFELGIYAGKIWLKDEGVDIVEEEAVLSRDGEGVWLRGAFHFGEIPVFEQKEVVLECFVLGVDIDVVPKKVRFELVERLRGVMDFESVDELVVQIGRDVERVWSVGM